VTQSWSEGTDVVYALVCLKAGSVLEVLEGAAVSQPLRDLAMAARELLHRTQAAAELSGLFARLGGEAQSQHFQEIAFFSERGAQVLMRLPEQPERALIAVGHDPEQLGLMRFQARAHVQRLREGM
jgi:hypothetical protein